jgi:16S rRNA (cytosine1402-N4)-methyltransferase
MRINTGSQGVTASDLLNGLRKDQLETLFGAVMDKGAARWLTKRITKNRKELPINSVGDFLEICQGLRTKGRIHPATLPFLALRMAVNSERENLEEALPKAFGLLSKGGKLLLITFHSQEQKIVEDFFHEEKRKAEGQILTPKPIVPGAEEVLANPRARSAELWVLQKI